MTARRKGHFDGCRNIFHFVIAKCSAAQFAVDKPGEISHKHNLDVFVDHAGRDG